MKKESVVLVVEDEPLIRMLAVEIIEEAGYSALEAENANAAIVVLAEHPEVSCVFSDVNMPGALNGVDLAVIVHCRWPNMNVILTSALPQHLTGRLAGSDQFLVKPYSYGELSSALEICISSHRS